jgi:uncharacterized protein
MDADVDECAELGDIGDDAFEDHFWLNVGELADFFVEIGSDKLLARIATWLNPLDCTAVHPESYPVVEQIARSLDTPVGELIANPQLLTKVDACHIDAVAFTVKDILEELRKPGHDPREQFVTPNFNEKVREFADVQPEMILEGVVTNVTRFGAFVDIGVHQVGLVHISELFNRFTKDPSEAVQAGQIVKVKALSADAKAKRIALSMKALMGPCAGE